MLPIKKINQNYVRSQIQNDSYVCYGEEEATISIVTKMGKYRYDLVLDYRKVCLLCCLDCSNKCGLFPEIERKINKICIKEEKRD